MAHARRKFFDLYENNKSPMAHQALEFIQQLYEVEREVKDLSAEERWKIRQSRGKPIWLTSTILTAGRQLCWPVETGNDLYGLLLG